MVEFVDVYQEKAAEAPLCVLLAFEVDTVGISEAQFGWQQEVEPGGFVKPLFADKDQDLMVHDRIVEQRGQYADKPFPEIVPKLRLVAFDMHRIGQVADRVAHAVP